MAPPQYLILGVLDLPSLLLSYLGVLTLGRIRGQLWFYRKILWKSIALSEETVVRTPATAPHWASPVGPSRAMFWASVKATSPASLFI